ncbi:hypothetical protein MishRS11D_34660 [Methylomagnum ishizawai]|nr:hypothetical protein MishRS11D_34660 [Methylomagnum ishizawai]
MKPGWRKRNCGGRWDTGANRRAACGEMAPASPIPPVANTGGSGEATTKTYNNNPEKPTGKQPWLIFPTT